MIRPGAWSLLPLLGMVLGLACAGRSAQALDREIQADTTVTDEGGPTPLEGRLAFRSPEAMAIQEVSFSPDPEAERRLIAALERYRNQWTLQLTIGPRAGKKADPQNPLGLDIENNGGMWRDHERNLRRLLFEMKDFIRMKLPSGEEVEPALVEYERSFGVGLDRRFLLVFPAVHKGRPIKAPFEIVVREFGQGMGTLRFPMTRTPESVARWKVKKLWQSNSKPKEGRG